MKRTMGSTLKGMSGSLFSRARTFHSSALRQGQDREDEDDDDDSPWGDLDKAFENLQDKSLYKQVYLKHPSDPTAPRSNSSAPAATPAKDPIAEMEEAIFAQAGAAAVKTTSNPPRPMTTGALGGVSFSDMPPSASGGVGMAAHSMPHSAGHHGSMPGAEASAKWSEYMQDSSPEDDSPWASLDAFVDNPESSAQFAVPLHLQHQQNVMQTSAQQQAPHFSPQPPPPQQESYTAGEALAATDDLLRQQMQLQSNQEPDAEEDAFARAGAAAVAQLFHHSAASSASRSDPVDAEDSTRLSHIDPVTGGASMVDVSHKSTTSRSATAVGRVYLPSSVCNLVLATESQQGISNKGPVLHTAQLAGIMAAKRTSDLIPLCHPLPLTHVDVQLDVIEGDGEESWILVECTARTAGQTGVEMEALTGCTVACLTVWDMVKAVAGKTMRIGEIMVVKKSGGKSGDWVRRT